MNLLLDGDAFCWQKKGGITRIYSEVLPRLLAMDPCLQMQMTLPGKPVSPVLRDFEYSCVAMHQVPSGLRPWKFWNVMRPRINRVLSRVCWEKCNADLFHSTYYAIPPRKTPSVCFVHDMIHELFPDLFRNQSSDELRMRKRLAVESARIVMCNSFSTMHDLVRILNVPESKCRVVHLAGYGKEEDAWHDKEDQRTELHPFVLYVGDYLSDYKNFSFLLNCLECRGVSDVDRLDLVVVSSLALHSGMVDGKRLFGGGEVRFINDCDDANLIQLYKKCSAFIYPSLYEGFGVPLLEALSVGTPVVCSNIPAFQEVGGDVVCYFDPKSPDGLMGAINKALDEGRGAQKVQQRVQHAESFSWDNTAHDFYNVFKDAVG